jgi:hypothetical protein
MRDLTKAEKATLADGFASGLDNPEDAKFRWTKIRKPSIDTLSSFEYCGMVNVKNNNGRYDGWQPYPCEDSDRCRLYYKGRHCRAQRRQQA